MARPKKDIDHEQVKKLAQIGCAVTEIAAILECSPDTLQRRFAAVIKEGHEHRNSSLRRRQFEAANSGNITMLIWLGKQYLGQKDKQELGGPDGGAIPVNLEGIDEAIRSLVNELSTKDRP